MQSDAIKFMEERLKDEEYGGYFPVTDCEGKIVVSTDKRIADQIDAALLYIEKGDADAADFSIKALDKLYNYDQGGFTELTDRYWNPHGVGTVRTLHLQLDAARALALYANKFIDEAYWDRPIELLEKLGTLATDGELASIYSADWRIPLDYEVGLDLEISATNFIATLKRLGVSEKVDALLPLTKRLARRFDEGSSKFHPREFFSCEIRAKSILAIANLASVNSDEALFEKTSSFLLDTIKLYRDVQYSGFWSRVNIHGQVKVDWQVSYARNYSPFPIKRALDAALLLRAMRDCRYSDSAIESELIEAIKHFHDSQSGGFFLGMGYFWSTPEDPTVPFARQFWAAPRCPGICSIGNLSYLPLHVKTLETQVACAHVIEPQFDVPASKTGTSTGKLQDYMLDGSFCEAHKGTAPPLSVNVGGYLSWLDRARASKSLPYGLTAEISPLGFRADRTWQAFSTLHVLSDLRTLDVPIASVEDLIRSIRDCQNADGGFSEQPGQLSDIFATYCATISLRLLNSSPLNPRACITYVNRCQNADGGYGNVPGLRSDIWHTNLAVLSLHALDAEPDSKKGGLNFTLSCQTAGGGFSNMPGLPPDTFSTYRAISTFTVLGKRLIDTETTINWLRDLQGSSGAFLYRPGHAYSLVGTYMAIASLYLLDSEPKFVEEARKWIASHQKDDGGFGPLGRASATTDESFTCIQTLFILQRSLTSYWVAVIN